jgi:hypothetical protein
MQIGIFLEFQCLVVFMERSFVFPRNEEITAYFMYRLLRGNQDFFYERLSFGVVVTTLKDVSMQFPNQRTRYNPEAVRL